MAQQAEESLRPLSEWERQALAVVTRATSERVDRVRRARALLAVARTGPRTEAPFIPFWRRRQELPYDDPPLRLILIWDNLAGHHSPEMVRWLCAQGILPSYTPLSGSWLNMAEALQRIVVPRALAGQHPATPAEIIT